MFFYWTPPPLNFGGRQKFTVTLIGVVAASLAADTALAATSCPCADKRYRDVEEDTVILHR